MDQLKENGWEKETHTSDEINEEVNKEESEEDDPQAIGRIQALHRESIRMIRQKVKTNNDR